MKLTATKTLLSFAIVGAALTAPAQSKTFVIGEKGRDARQIATVESVSDFETFTGRTSTVRGSVRFDPTRRLGSGTIQIDLTGLDTGIPLRNEHMRSPMWLDVAKYPTATFTATRVETVGKDQYRVRGKFTLKGVTKEITTNVTAKYRGEDARTKAAGFEGDVLQISTKFDIRLSDYGITIPSVAANKVNNQVTLAVTVFGVTG